jgi:hypothetical protein
VAVVARVVVEFQIYAKNTANSMVFDG